MSYRVLYESMDGKCLIGGVMKSRTSRFQRKSDAELRIQSILDIHPGRKISWIVEEVDLPPEIFHHCDDAPATCVGCVCAGCGILLTEADAEAAARR